MVAPIGVGVGVGNTQEQLQMPKVRLEKRKISFGSNPDKVEQFDLKLQEIKRGGNEKYFVDKSYIQKMNKLKKNAVKEIIGYKGMFNTKFILHWTKSYNYSQWVATVDTKISCLSPQSGLTNNNIQYYENGDHY